MTEWDPNVRVGTWHPMGHSRWYGPIMVEQRIDGRRTGVHYFLTARQYWLHRALSVLAIRRVPLAERVLRSIRVIYRYPTTGERGQA